MAGVFVLFFAMYCGIDTFELFATPSSLLALAEGHSLTLTTGWSVFGVLSPPSPPSN